MPSRSQRRAPQASPQSNGDDERIFLPTQPGWAFATLAELRRLGVNDYASFYHRDSSVVVGDSPSLANNLTTPAGVFMCLLTAGMRRDGDASSGLQMSFKPATLKEAVLRRLSEVPNAPRRRYSITTEVYGRTSIRRQALDAFLEDALSEAFPRWRRTSQQGLRFYCKADRQSAFLGLQRYSNLNRKDDGIPGSLRDHLACGLLALSGVSPDDTVFDPFMGTGTILNAARRRFGCGSCIGLEVDKDAYRIAKAALKGPGVSLFNSSFDDFDPGALPENARLVSNIPFGVRFQRAPTETLLNFIERSPLKPERVTLLASRDQAREIAGPLGLRTKNVLVLGQPAAIVFHSDS